MRKAAYIGGAILILVVLVIVFFRPSQADDETRPISAMLTDLKVDGVRRIDISDDKLTVTLVTGFRYVTYKEHDVSLFAMLADNEIDAGSVVIEVESTSNLGGWLGLALNFFPLFFFGGIVYALVVAVRKISRQ